MLCGWEGPPAAGVWGWALPAAGLLLCGWGGPLVAGVRGCAPPAAGLGGLHALLAARKISIISLVTAWLSAGGLVGDVQSLSVIRFSVMSNRSCMPSLAASAEAAGYMSRWRSRLPFALARAARMDSPPMVVKRAVRGVLSAPCEK